MKKQVKIAIGAALGVLLAALGAFYALKPLAVEVTVLAPQTAAITFTEQGLYDYGDSYRIFPIVAGEVLEVMVREGDRVEAGDILAVVSASDYEYQILQLESAIKGYNAQISELWTREQQEKEELRTSRLGLEGQLETVEAEILKQERTVQSLDKQIDFQQDVVAANRRWVRLLEEDADEAKDLYGRDSEEHRAAGEALASARTALAASQVQLEQLRSGTLPDDYYEGQKNTLRAQIESIDERLGKSYTGSMTSYYQAQIESVQTSIDQMRERLGKTAITAPVSGVISELSLDSTNLISEQSCVAVIGSRPGVEVFVSTRDLDGIAVGDSVELIVEKRLGDETVPGTVRQIDDKAQLRLSALGVEERKVRVVVQHAGRLTVGGNVDVRFSLFEQPNSLVVPKTAVFQSDGEDCVFVVRDGRAELRPVLLGMETREGYIVSEGLSEGESVVTDCNLQGLSDGKRVAAG